MRSVETTLARFGPDRLLSFRACPPTLDPTHQPPPMTGP